MPHIRTIPYRTFISSLGKFFKISLKSESKGSDKFYVSKTEVLKMKNQVNEKTDITMHSDEELSLLVFNTEPLYKLRRHSRALIHDTIREMFIFTSEQFDTLMQDIDDDLNEDKISRETVGI